VLGSDGRLREGSGTLRAACSMGGRGERVALDRGGKAGTGSRPARARPSTVVRRRGEGGGSSRYDVSEGVIDQGDARADSVGPAGGGKGGREVSPSPHRDREDRADDSRHSCTYTRGMHSSARRPRPLTYRKSTLTTRSCRCCRCCVDDGGGPRCRRKRSNPPGIGAGSKSSPFRPRLARPAQRRRTELPPLGPGAGWLASGP
jgi:hypothetical protein